MVLTIRGDRNVLRWFGHVERMEDERLLKKVVNARVDGRGARGRPKFGWMDGVKKALNNRMGVSEAREHARNRNEWRRMVMQLWRNSGRSCRHHGATFCSLVMEVTGALLVWKRSHFWMFTRGSEDWGSPAVPTKPGQVSRSGSKGTSFGSPLCFFPYVSATPLLGETAMINK